jgi:hypothetical protein
VLVVELAGFRFMGNYIVGNDPADPADPGDSGELEDITCGMTVRVAFEENGGRTLLGWSRASGPS